MSETIDEQQRYWEEQPYGDYLNAVDYALEQITGTTSDQDELQIISEYQEASVLPSACAIDLVLFFRTPKNF